MPAYNEEAAITVSLTRLNGLLRDVDFTYEVIVVDDGSKDETSSLVKLKCTEWPQLRLISLQANRGHMIALTAGLENAAGQWIVTIDADLQDPPEVIFDMLSVIQANPDVRVVYGVRGDRTSDSWFKKYSASLYYRIIRKLTGVEAPRHAADFRMMAREVVEIINQIPERNRVYRLLVPWLGFESETVLYTRAKRIAGNSHYKFRHMLALAWDSVVSFSSRPLRIAMWLGVWVLIGFAVGSIIVISGHLRGADVPGWSSTVLLIMFSSSIQLLTVGILGEYVARLYVEVQRRPMYTLKKNEESPQD